MLKSGTLRRRFNKAVQEKIICRNMLLMTLAAMKKVGEYSGEASYIKSFLMERGYSEEYIDNIISQIDEEYYPTKKQIAAVVELIGKDYTYEEGYIKDELLRSVDIKALMAEDGRALKKYIYDTEQVELILESLGCDKIRKRKDGKYWSCSNPDGDNPGAIVVRNTPYLGVTNYTRWDGAENSKADIIQLVSYILKCGYREALLYIRELLGGSVSSKKIMRAKLRDIEAKKEENNYEEKVFDENLLKAFQPVLHQLWKAEGITEEAREAFEICYYPMREQIFIPYRRWHDGALVGFNRRETSEYQISIFSRKYTLLAGSNKSRNVYGYYQNKSEIEKAGYCTIFESEKSVLKRFSNGDRTAVATMGKNITLKQIEILKTLDVEEFVLAYDADVCKEEIYRICEQFYIDGRKVSYIYDFMGFMGEKDAPADLKDEEYRCLFDMRTIYDEKEREKYIELLAIMN